jgi:hypothetical protein
VSCSDRLDFLVRTARRLNPTGVSATHPQADQAPLYREHRATPARRPRPQAEQRRHPAPRLIRQDIQPLRRFSVADTSVEAQRHFQKLVRFNRDVDVLAPREDLMTDIGCMKYIASWSERYLEASVGVCLKSGNFIIRCLLRNGYLCLDWPVRAERRRPRGWARGIKDCLALNPRVES